MEIKGTSVKSTHNFVKKVYPNQEQLWIDSLPQSSKMLVSNPVMATQWYPIMDGMIILVEKIAELFFEGDVEKAAFEIGKFSAIEGLNGVYKIFVKMASPIFVLKRSPKIFNTYYSEVNFEIVEAETKKAVFKITGFKPEHVQIFSRIAGWIEETLRIIGSKPISVKHSFEQEDVDFIIGKVLAEWE
ncbi:MAG: hypothetical protein JXL97_14410 [Bacteroidales bacterium]|nr:hypothetical protein [Bacteroidales bacterium]